MIKTVISETWQDMKYYNLSYDEDEPINIMYGRNACAIIFWMF